MKKYHEYSRTIVSVRYNTYKATEDVLAELKNAVESLQVPEHMIEKLIIREVKETILLPDFHSKIRKQEENDKISNYDR